MISAFKSNLLDCPQSKLHYTLGIIFILYAMAGYPLIGYLLGHVYPRSLPFGLVSFPTTIFTFGMFLLINKKFPRCYLIIPFIIAIAGLLAIYKGVYEDIGLLLSGLIGRYLIIKRDTRIDKKM
jgi:hypothetical protein